MFSRTLSKAAFATLLILGAVFSMRHAYLDQMVFSGMVPNRVSEPSVRHPEVLTKWAREEHQMYGDLVSAEMLYTKALTSNPVYIPAWLGLGELAHEKGETERARAILQYVDSLTEEVKLWRWEKALLAYQLGQDEIVADDLAFFVEADPSMHTKAFEMAESLWPDPLVLLERIGKSQADHVLRYFMNTKQTEKTKAVWPILEKGDDLSSREKALEYAVFLFNQNEISAAADVWKGKIAGEALVFNGGFENPPLQTGFGWRIGVAEGASWRVESCEGASSSKCMHVTFQGDTNLAFHHLYQYVPLDPGKPYVFSGIMRTEDVSTDQRPYWEVTGYGCEGLRMVMPMVAESQPWTPFEMVFETPLGCEVVTIRLRRDSSYNIDSKVSGDMWIDDVMIEPVVR